MKQVGIVGAGDIGANVAFFLAERNVAPVVVYDETEGLSTGKALDIMELAPLSGYRYPLQGSDSLEDVLGTDVIVIAAGAPRTSDLSRRELLEQNLPEVEQLASSLRDFQGVVVVATEPVDPLVTILARMAQLPPNRVIGVGCAVDSLRLRSLLATELDTASEDVNALVIGRHDADLIPLPQYCRAGGVPVSSFIPESRLKEIVDETRQAGTDILRDEAAGSAFYAPATAAVDIVEAIVRDTGRVLPVTTALQGQYGLHGVALSLPAVLGAEGVRRLFELQLDRDERRRLDHAAETVRRMTVERKGRGHGH